MSNKPNTILSASTIKEITPSDTVDLNPRPYGLLIAAQDDIAFVNDDDTVTTISSGELSTGLIHPLSPKRIDATNSGASLKIYGVFE